MPAILLASKMKSGLPKPKPVHSALPIPQVPSRPLTLPLPLPMPLKPSYRHIPTLGPQRGLGHHQGVWGAPNTKSAPVTDGGIDTQVRERPTASSFSSSVAPFSLYLSPFLPLSPSLCLFPLSLYWSIAVSRSHSLYPHLFLSLSLFYTGVCVCLFCCFYCIIGHICSWVVLH